MTQLRQPDDRSRTAFTLVEMLVVMTILMLLASIVLFGLSGVQEHARDRRVRAQIMRIHQIISERMASFENRRVRLQTQPGSYLNTYNIPANSPEARLLSTRELMRMEMPDRITDVQDAPVILENVPNVAMGFRRTVANIAFQGNVWTTSHQGAECLYMILARTYIGDSNGLQFFTEREIGDTDNDGMLEMLDPWGNPIEFLRWAPGLTSPPDDNRSLAGVSTIQGNDPLAAWDPMDPLRIDGDADNVKFFVRPENQRLFVEPRHTPQPGETFSNFAMFPLIFSAGPDGAYNVAVGVKSSSGVALPVHYNGSDVPRPDYPNDPYAIFKSGGETIRLGQVGDLASQGHLDNITNHFIEAE